jgi:hypothetical protein
MVQAAEMMLILDEILLLYSHLTVVLVKSLDPKQIYHLKKLWPILNQVQVCQKCFVAHNILRKKHKIYENIKLRKAIMSYNIQNIGCMPITGVLYL